MAAFASAFTFVVVEATVVALEQERRAHLITTYMADDESL
jgi:hypothetical protein